MLTFVGATEKKLLFGGVGGGFGEIQNSEDEDDRSRHCRKGQFLIRKNSRLVLIHKEVQIVNFRRWSSIPDVHFCPKLGVLMVELNVFYKKILFVTV